MRTACRSGELLHRTFLPALTMVLVVVAHMMRMTRAAIINLLASPYIEMARLKGTPPWRVIVKHALPNAWAPIINVVALNLAYLITGVVLVEVVFVYPGIGQLPGRQRDKARLPGGPGLLPDLRSNLHPAEPCSRRGVNSDQPASAASEVRGRVMNYFIIGYYALLIGCSCLAAHYKQREAFLLICSDSPWRRSCHGDHRRRVGPVDRHRPAPASSHFRPERHTRSGSSW